MVNPSDDRTLIEVKPERGSGVFYSAIVATVAVLTIAWGAVMDGFLRFKTPLGFTTAEYNIADLVRQVRNPNPRFAIVGCWRSGSPRVSSPTRA